MKEEYVLDAKEAAELLHLLPVAVAAKDALLRAMRTVCCVNTKEFQNLHKMENSPED